MLTVPYKPVYKTIKLPCKNTILRLSGHQQLEPQMAAKPTYHVYNRQVSFSVVEKENFKL